MRRFRWQPGRQGTGYRKLLPGRRHWRANLVLCGERSFQGAAALRIGPLVVFRPDVTPHSVEQVTRRRVVLSFGVAL